MNTTNRYRNWLWSIFLIRSEDKVVASNLTRPIKAVTLLIAGGTLDTYRVYLPIWARKGQLSSK